MQFSDWLMNLHPQSVLLEVIQSLIPQYGYVEAPISVLYCRFWSLLLSCRHEYFFGKTYTTHKIYTEINQVKTQEGKSLFSEKSFLKFLRSEGNKAYPLTMGSTTIPVYCHVTDDLGPCGGGGWTLVMKIDGSKVRDKQQKLFSDFTTNLSNL